MDEHLINTVNKLQDALATLGPNQNPIDLPQIAVVGSQSSGKSSVLENIVGRDFLPRGTGIVTRRPLILQLINYRSPSSEVDSIDRTNENNKEEWGEFLHIKGKKFYDFDQIRQEIVNETEKVTGKNAGISSSPINLRIYSPHVLTLTLVDLPGLTKVPVGDQPRDIEIRIKEMIMSFIKKPNSIILSVTAANTDLANSDGLKLAREVDPEGSRTIGVLTKIDLMDKGTDVLDIMNGRIIPLRLGYVPVINRGQKDIQDKKAIKEALEFETRYFAQHSSYSSKVSLCGTPYLARRLNTILFNHIRQTLPDIRSRIDMTLQRYKQELLNLGPEMEVSSSNVILNAITEFCNEYRSVLDGKDQEVSSLELSGGARISFVFHEIFANGVRALDPFDQIRDVDIRTILYNSAGSAPALFVGTGAFEVLVRKQIKRFEDPSLKCVSLVYDEIVRIMTQILVRPMFARYPQLRDKISEVVIQFLRASLVPTNKLVTDIISSEECYINTAHPNFLKGEQAMKMVSDNMAISRPVQLDPKTGKPLPQSSALNTTSVSASDSSSQGFFSNFFASKNKKRIAAMDPPPSVLKASGPMSDRETKETEVIKLLIVSYFDIVRKTVADSVPKAVMLKFIRHSKEEMQKELLEKIYKLDKVDELLRENEITVARRKECKKMVEALSKASEIVSTV